MTYIKQLQNDNRLLKKQKSKGLDEILLLREHLMSSKFHTCDMINVRDVESWLDNICTAIQKDDYEV